MTYNKFSWYLKNRFGCRVGKISVNAGFSCPNRDGKISDQGCIYCDNLGFNPNAGKSLKPLRQQIEEGITLAARKGIQKYILYFQSFTNTYSDIGTLKAVYDVINEYQDFVMLSIGTRPDCVDLEILELINSYSKKYEVWIEYGMQSRHDQTLKAINRGHVYQDFLNAVEMTRGFDNIKICAHVILGLPGETEDDILQTAAELGRLKMDGVKLHPLHVIKGTKLDAMYRDGDVKLLCMDEYISCAVKCLELLWPETVVQRLTADCPREYLVAPLWLEDKSAVIRKIEETLKSRCSRQGEKWKRPIY